MKEYTIEMIETRTYDVTYVVHAENEQQAKIYAREGNTEREVDNGCRDVVHRTVCDIVSVFEVEEEDA